MKKLKWSKLFNGQYPVYLGTGTGPTEYNCYRILGGYWGLHRYGVEGDETITRHRTLKDCKNAEIEPPGQHTRAVRI